MKAWMRAALAIVVMMGWNPGDSPDGSPAFPQRPGPRPATEIDEERFEETVRSNPRFTHDKLAGIFGIDKERVKTLKRRLRLTKANLPKPELPPFQTLQHKFLAHYQGMLHAARCTLSIVHNCMGA